MKVSITKLPSGAVRFDYDNRSPQFLNNATDAETQECKVGSSNAPGVQVQYGGGKIVFKYADILNINGEPKPPTLAETILLLGSEVFNFGGGNGGGVAGEPVTNASFLTSGILPDGRLSGNIARVPGITTATALNFDFPDSVIELEVIGDLPTDNSDARTPVDVVLVFYKNTQLLFKCNASMAIQGQSSANAPKKGYEADFFNASGDPLLIKWGKCHPVDGVNFKGFYTDPTHSKDISAGRLWHRIRTSRPFPGSFIADFVNDQASTNTKFQYYDDALFYPEGFPMHMKVNVETYGLYTWRMKKKRENYRLDSKNNANIFLDSDTNAGLNFSQFVPGQWDLKSPKLTGYETAGPIPNTTVLASIDRFFNWMGGCISGNTDMRATYGQYLNLESFVDIIVTAELVHSVDLNNNNTELMTWDGLRWSICIYDQDLTLGVDSFTAGEHSSPNQQVLNAPMWAKIKSVFEFEIKARYTELRRTGIITMNALEEIYSQIPRTIPTDYYIENFDKWGWPGSNWTGVKWYTSLRNNLDFLQKKLVFLDTLYLNPEVTNGASTAPVITIQPTNKNYNVGDVWSINVDFTGNPIPTVQWQGSVDGVNFADLSPASSGTVTSKNWQKLTGSDDAGYYRAKVSNTVGTVYSNVIQVAIGQSTGGGGGTPVDPPPTGTLGALTGVANAEIDFSRAPDFYTATQKTGDQNIHTLLFQDYLPADTDGYFEFAMNSDVDGVAYNTRNVYIGFAETPTLIDNSNMTLNLKVGLMPRAIDTRRLLVKDNDFFYSDGNEPETRGNAAAESKRIRIVRTGNVFSVQHSQDFGATYLLLYTFQNYSYTGKLYILAGLIDGGFTGGSELALPKGSGLNK